MFTFASDYYLFVFTASLGVLQIAASVGRLNGLLLLKWPIPARSLGAALAVAAAVWFFSSDTRNLNDFKGGLDANVQALFFFFGALSALAATLLVSSLVNLRMNGGTAGADDGRDALRHVHYGRALARSLRLWRREWRTRTKPYFFG